MSIRPRQHVSRGPAIEQRQGGLEVVDRAAAPTALQELGLEVADPGAANLPGAAQLVERVPRRFHDVEVVNRPVQLIDVNLFQLKPPQRFVALTPQRRRTQIAVGTAAGRIDVQPGLGEDERPLALGEARERRKAILTRDE